MLNAHISNTSHGFCQNFTCTRFLFVASRIHDRKMSVLGLCSVLQSPVRPAAVQSKAALIVPTIMDQLTQLLEAYKSKQNISYFALCVSDERAVMTRTGL